MWDEPHQRQSPVQINPSASFAAGCDYAVGLSGEALSMVSVPCGYSDNLGRGIGRPLFSALRESCSGHAFIRSLSALCC
jgi:hypothetical protein